ncbi:hypothetical protein Z046_00670 [Pseudomonas aeruginosa VRFPA09]|nr:hypothetical protein Z046_00670 [Pseudomonas aeruginosa VRFPA09]
MLQTANPASSTAAGGYVLLLGSEVENAGQIVTPKGQTTLAAGDSFYIRRGVGTDGNLRSTTRGNEVATSLAADSAAGRVVNQGLIQAATGDITLTGRQVRQEGVALSSSSTDVRGTIHLLNSASDARGSVVLGEGSPGVAARGGAVAEYRHRPAGLARRTRLDRPSRLPAQRRRADRE